MTTLAQTVLILDELAANYRAEVDAGMPERWFRQIGKFDLSDVEAAVIAIEATPRAFMPSVGEFAETVRQLRARPFRDDEEPLCPTCEGHRWIDAPPMTDGEIVYDMVKPCSVCSPALCDAVAGIQAKSARERRARGVERLLPFKLGDQLAAVRAELHKADES